MDRALGTIAVTIGLFWPCCASREAPCAGDDAGIAPPGGTSETSGGAPRGLAVLRGDGVVLDGYLTLTRTFAPDEGLAGLVDCGPGLVPWLAGGRASRGGFALCLPREPTDGTYASPIAVSLSRPAPLAPLGPRSAIELVHEYWIGSGRAQVSIHGGAARVEADVTLGHRTHPASFTGGVDDETVTIKGEGRLVP